MKTKIKLKRSCAAISFLVLILAAFQNCSLRDIQNVRSFASIAKTANSGGNGGAYDGKPGDIFYRHLPDFSCEGTPVHKELIQIGSDGNGKLVKNNYDKCGASEVEIGKSSIGLSPFQNDFIYYDDLVFRKYAVPPVGIPDQIAELLCRDNFETPSVEVIAHHDLVLKAAVLRAYYYNLDPNTEGQKKTVISIPDFQTSRVLGEVSLTYAASQIELLVDLTVDQNTPNQLNRKFKGKIINSSISALPKELNLTCVSGGDIIPQGWPIRKISDLNYKNLWYHEPTQSILAIGGKSSNAILRLNAEKLEVEDLTTPVIGKKHDVSFVDINFQNPLLFLKTQLSPDLPPSAYFFDTITKKLQQVTNRNYKDSSSVLDSYSSITDVGASGFLIRAELGKTGQSIVRLVRNFESEPIDLSTELTNKLHYQYLPQSGQFVSIDTTDLKSLVVFDFLRKSTEQNPSLLNKRVLNLSLPTGCEVYPNALKVFDKEKKIYGSLSCPSGIWRILVTLETGKAEVMPLKFSSIYWSTSDTRFAVFHQHKIQYLQGEVLIKQPLVYDFETGKSFGIPFEKQKISLHQDSLLKDPMYWLRKSTSGLAYFKESKSLVFLSIPSSEENIEPKLFLSQLTEGTNREICGSMPGTKSALFPSRNSADMQVVSYDRTKSIFYFYRVLENGSCERINEFPSDKSFIRKLIPSKQGSFLFLSDNYDAYLRTFDEIVFLPSNGRAPIRLNDQGRKIKQIVDVVQDPKSDKIFLIGNTLDSGLVNLFLFDLKW